MAAWDDFASNWVRVIANPIGYAIQRIPIEQAANEYANSNPPSLAVTAEVTTPEAFTRNRQQWIDGCGASLKSRDVGYSKANAAQNCAARFDQDGLAQIIEQEMDQRAIDEQAEVKQKVQDNIKIILGIAGISVVIALAVYLFTDK